MRRVPYPLQWPPRLPRTKPGDRRRSAFGGRAGRDSLSPHATGVEVCTELSRLGSSSWVITSNLPSRGTDGIPYAEAPKADDPGIAVWFVLDGIERVLACDCWYRPQENLRAIARSIEAMRALERWGVADIISSVFTGFTAALPSGEPAAARPWREVLGGDWPALAREDLLALAKARHRRAIGAAHPDHGGDTAAAAEINAALAAAEAELSS